MSGLTYGELFAGYDGLGMGVRSVLGGETSWFCEFDKAPSRILAHHYPGVPNYGDVTKVDWATVPKVDVITGGSPCQDLSHAGKRKGMTDGTRSNLWVQMREAIATIRPRLVVWENVRGALSADAASDVEPCAGCVGGADDGEPSLRALGRVVGDLAELGYVGRYYGLRAADVGGAHGRFRVFLFATPQDAPSLGEPARPASPIQKRRPEDAAVRSLRPTSRALLPTPAVNDMGAGKTLEWWDAWTAKMRDKHGNGNGHGASLAIELQRWEHYAPALDLWSEVIGRPHPDPLTESRETSPQFCEWLMGLPEGHVTDPAIGLSANAQLKAIGNGVCPQQAAAATRAFLADTRQEKAA